MADEWRPFRMGVSPPSATVLDSSRALQNDASEDWMNLNASLDELMANVALEKEQFVHDRAERPQRDDE